MWVSCKTLLQHVPFHLLWRALVVWKLHVRPHVHNAFSFLAHACDKWIKGDRDDLIWCYGWIPLHQQMPFKIFLPRILTLQHQVKHCLRWWQRDETRKAVVDGVQLSLHDKLQSVAWQWYIMSHGWEASCFASPIVHQIKCWKMFCLNWSQVSLFLEFTYHFCNSGLTLVLLRSPNALLNDCLPVVVFYLTFAQQPLLLLLGLVFV